MFSKLNHQRSCRIFLLMGYRIFILNVFQKRVVNGNRLLSIHIYDYIYINVCTNKLLYAAAYTMCMRNVLCLPCRISILILHLTKDIIFLGIGLCLCCDLYLSLSNKLFCNIQALGKVSMFLFQYLYVYITI